MEFRTEYNRGQNKKTPSGTKTLSIYDETFDKDGKRELKEVGKTNIYNKIQTAAKETDVYTILEKYQKTGDVTLINKRNAIYGDFRNLPSTPIEMQNRLMKAEKEFNSIDKEVRAEFNNSVEEFKASIINGSFEQKMKKFYKETEKKVETTKQQTQTPSQGVNLNE